MNLFFIYFCSVIMSLGFRFKYALKMYKDFADCGYKFDSKRLSEVSNSMPNQTKSICKSFIPLYNLLLALKETKVYEENKQSFFDFYYSMGILVEMTEDEKNNYLKEPTLLNAIKISSGTYRDKIKLNIDVNSKTCNISYIYSDGVKNEVKFVIDVVENECQIINILNVSGPLACLSHEEHIKFITDNFLKYFSNTKTKYTIIDKTKNTTEYNTKIAVNESSKKETVQLSKIDRYKQLKESIIKNGYLYGEDFVEYKELEEEFSDDIKLTLK